MNHVPLRTCLGCGRRDPKQDLMRLVCDTRRGLQLDPRGRSGGRGGYLHAKEDCWQGFAKRGGMIRSLKAAVERAERAALVDRLRQGDEQ